MKLSQCTDEVHRCTAFIPKNDYRYFENVGTRRNNTSVTEQSNIRFPYFSLLIIRHNGF